MPNYKLFGYYTDWDMYGRNYMASQIPVKNVNNIVYAFINYSVNGDITETDPNSDIK